MYLYANNWLPIQSSYGLTWRIGYEFFFYLWRNKIFHLIHMTILRLAAFVLLLATAPQLWAGIALPTKRTVQAPERAVELPQVLEREAPTSEAQVPQVPAEAMTQPAASQPATPTQNQARRSTVRQSAQPLRPSVELQNRSAASPRTSLSLKARVVRHFAILRHRLIRGFEALGITQVTGRGGAVASLVLGIIGLVFVLSFALAPIGMLLCLIALILGAVNKGESMATAGLILGIIGLVLGLIFTGLIVAAAASS